MSRFLGLIPARGGSKGIPRKNIKQLAGLPMIAHTIKAGLGASSIDTLVVSSDDEDILNVAKQYGLDVPFTRPDELALDETLMRSVIFHTIEFYEQRQEYFDHLVLLQPTSPLRNETHIDDAINIYESMNFDSLVSTYADYSYRWQKKPEGGSRINYLGPRKNRQSKQPEYVENGAIYIVSIPKFLEHNNLQEGRTGIFEMNPVDSINIDDPFDFWLAEKILQEWKNQ